MKPKSLSQTNPYLKNLKQREARLMSSVISSSAVENIRIGSLGKSSQKQKKTNQKT